MRPMNPEDFNQYSNAEELIITSVETLVQLFNEADATDFLTLTYVDGYGKEYSITVQNNESNHTPEEKIHLLEEKLEKLRMKLEKKDELINDLHNQLIDAKNIAYFYQHHALNLTKVENDLSYLKQKEQILKALKKMSLKEISASTPKAHADIDPLIVELIQILKTKFPEY